MRPLVHPLSSIIALLIQSHKLAIPAPHASQLLPVTSVLVSAALRALAFNSADSLGLGLGEAVARLL